MAKKRDNKWPRPVPICVEGVEKEVPNEVKEELVQLVNLHPQGILGSEIPIQYIKHTAKELKPPKWGFMSLLELLCTIPQIRIHHIPGNNQYRVNLLENVKQRLLNWTKIEMHGARLSQEDVEKGKAVKIPAYCMVKRIDWMICALCGCICLKPLALRCKHLFCFGCLAKTWVLSDECPTCHTVLDLNADIKILDKNVSRDHRYLLELFDNADVQCPFCGLGTFKYGEFYRHVALCSEDKPMNRFKLTDSSDEEPESSEDDSKKYRRPKHPLESDDELSEGEILSSDDDDSVGDVRQSQSAQVDFPSIQLMGIFGEPTRRVSIEPFTPKTSSSNHRQQKTTPVAHSQPSLQKTTPVTHSQPPIQKTTSVIHGQPPPLKTTPTSSRPPPVPKTTPATHEQQPPPKTTSSTQGHSSPQPTTAETRAASSIVVGDNDELTAVVVKSFDIRSPTPASAMLLKELTVALVNHGAHLDDDAFGFPNLGCVQKGESVQVFRHGASRDYPFVLVCDCMQQIGWVPLACFDSKTIKRLLRRSSTSTC